MHSKKYDLIKGYYDRGLWTADRVRNVAVKGWITEEECEEILRKNPEEQEV